MSSRYQDWLNHVFDHEVTDKLPQWYFAEDAPLFEASDEEMTELISQTFLNAGKDLTKYTDEQVDQGIWYFVSTSGANFLHSLKCAEVPLAKRLEAIGNIFHLYSNCFAKRCAETLGHLSEEGSALNSSCYMFWDICPITCLKETPNSKEMEDAVLNVLEKTLTIEHRACREGAFHGLSEMSYSRREAVQGIIDQFLSKTKLDEKLLAYARNAREGNVL
ncbi:MAG TPA: hypothetical protein VN784_05885 [Candidatus Limnocylindrales bacterium]|nr:hypothetical protein [Candidatus Limnocylindrales bacterium]